MSLEFLGRPETTLNKYRALQSLRKRPIIFLGLGGVGSASVSKIKRLFEKTFAEIAPEGQRSSIPEGIKFLCFDSAGSERPGNLAAGNEWFQMRAQRIDDVIDDLLKDPFYKPWLPRITGHDYQQGCGGVRSLGRLLFTRNIGTFSKEFDARMTEACGYHHLDETTPLVCVFVSLAGGTGSGSLLDACFYIRRNHPNAYIYGFLGAVGGAPLGPMSIRANATTGAYAALKEIDAFMSASRTTGDYATGTTFRFPAARAIQGTYTAPFDECFLVGTENDRGVHNLGDPNRLSSFLARSGFMLTAYSTDSGKGMRSYEAEMIDRKRGLPTLLKGAVSRYQVPALCQVHIPRETIADYLTAHVARKFLSFLSGGDPHPDDDSRAFVSMLGLALDELAEFVASLDDGRPLQIHDWAPVIEKELGDAKHRYSERGRAGILGYGQQMIRAREGQYAASVAGRVARKVGEVREAVGEKLAATSKNPRFRMTGAIDFLTDIEISLSEQIEELAKIRRDQFQPEEQDIQREWATVRAMVEEVCKKDRFINLDRFRLPKTIQFYTAFLRRSDAHHLRRATLEQAGEVLRSLLTFVQDQRQRMETLQGLLHQVEALIAAEESERAAELHSEGRGMGSSEEDICSFSLLDEEWRRTKLAEAPYAPEAVLNLLSAGEWGPTRWLDLTTVPQPAAALAQDLCDRLDLQFFRPLRSMTLTDLLDWAPIPGGNPAGELLERTLAQYTSPQMPLRAMTEHLNHEPPSLEFVSGVEPALYERLSQGSVFRNAVRASSGEDDKITCLRVFYPVALAGCDSLRDRFYPVYKQTMDECAAMRPASLGAQELRKYHGFGEALGWKDPIEYNRTASSEAEIIARAFAVSVVVDGQVLGASHPRHGEVTAAMAAAGAAAKGAPREVRLGLFRIGRSDFWLTPFFDIRSPARLGKPIRLGSKLSKVREYLLSKPTDAAEAQRWVTWFDENWTAFYTTDELRLALQEAINQARAAHATQTRDSVDEEQWGEMVSVLEDWMHSILG